MTNALPLSEKEFWIIYKKVPRLTVEIVLKENHGVYLTKRNIEPCKGLWHLPGGTVRFGEKLLEAVARIAKRELDIQVQETTLLGYIEYPSHFLSGLDSPVGIAFLIKSFKGKLTPNMEASNGAWFTDLPLTMHDEQREFIQKKVLSAEQY